MGKVATGFSISLDGFIASPNGDIGPLFDWYFAGDTEYAVPGGNFTLRVSAQEPATARGPVEVEPGWIDEWIE